MWPYPQSSFRGSSFSVLQFCHLQISPTCDVKARTKWRIWMMEHISGVLLIVNASIFRPEAKWNSAGSEKWWNVSNAPWGFRLESIATWTLKLAHVSGTLQAGGHTGKHCEATPAWCLQMDQKLDWMCRILSKWQQKLFFFHSATNAFNKVCLMGLSVISFLSLFVFFYIHSSHLWNWVLFSSRLFILCLAL